MKGECGLQAVVKPKILILCVMERGNIVQNTLGNSCNQKSFHLLKLRLDFPRITCSCSALLAYLLILAPLDMGLEAPPRA
jgi:hypothetical protein